MSDDLKKLATLLKEDVPPPNHAAKIAALDAGMAAFKNNSDNLQGSADAPRLTNNRPETGSGLLEGLKNMFTHLSPRGIMLGTASFATIALAVFITQNVDITRTGPRAPQGLLAPLQDSLGPVDSEIRDTPRPAPEETVSTTQAQQTGKTTLGLPQISGVAPVLEVEAAPAFEEAEIKDTTPPSAGITNGITANQAPQQAPISDDSRLRTQSLAAPLAEGFADTAPAAVIAPSPVINSIIAARDRNEAFIAPQSNDRFAGEAVSPVKTVLDEPVSTFSIDVDTASYSIMRRSLLNGYLPNPDSVRTEELINYFDYNYTSPQADEAPFFPLASVFPTPWNPDTLLLHVGIQGYEIPLDERPPVNLVFLIDTSGSMNAPNKLPLLIQSFRLLLGELSAQDTVAIVTYAGSAGMALEPTPADETYEILRSLTRLSSGGSTAGQAGLEQAYALAESMMDEGETSRVILATDGDFNVGISSPDALQSFIEEKRESGVYLSILGFGQGNYNDALMQTLAQNGNGTAAYIDTLAEAQKVLVEQLGGALFTIGQDVKIQIEFNPAEIAEYRLIGYETRALAREDFNNDAVDAGDIGAGTQVTAIYEITPVGSAAMSIDPLRYGEATYLPEGNGELAFLKLRYKLPGESVSNLITTPVREGNGVELSQDVIFSTAVASFGQLLRGDTRLGGWSFDDALRLAQQGKGDDPYGYQSEFIRLIRLAKTAQ